MKIIQNSPDVIGIIRYMSLPISVWSGDKDVDDENDEDLFVIDFEYKETEDENILTGIKYDSLININKENIDSVEEILFILVERILKEIKTDGDIQEIVDLIMDELFENNLL